MINVRQLPLDTDIYDPRLVEAVSGRAVVLLINGVKTLEDLINFDLQAPLIIGLTKIGEDGVEIKIPEIPTFLRNSEIERVRRVILNSGHTPKF